MLENIRKEETDIEKIGSVIKGRVEAKLVNVVMKIENILY